MPLTCSSVLIVTELPTYDLSGISTPDTSDYQFTFIAFFKAKRRRRMRKGGIFRLMNRGPWRDQRIDAMSLDEDLVQHLICCYHSILGHFLYVKIRTKWLWIVCKFGRFELTRYSFQDISYQRTEYVWIWASEASANMSKELDQIGFQHMWTKAKFVDCMHPLWSWTSCPRYFIFQNLIMCRTAKQMF